MCGMDLAAARFPLVGDRDPFYESFYLTAYDPVAPRALWLRHTVWKSPEGTPVGSVWRTLFDLDGPHADKWSTPELAAGPLIRVRHARNTPPVRLPTSATILAATASISWSVIVLSRGCSLTAMAIDFLPGSMPLPS